MENITITIVNPQFLLSSESGVGNWVGLLGLLQHQQEQQQQQHQ